MIPEAREVHLSRKDRKVLEACCRSPVTLQRDLKRARIVLLAAAGRSTRSIAKEVGVQPRIVSLWRHRYADYGLEGLQDKPRPGKQPIYTKTTDKRILKLLDKPPPQGFARWTGPLLAEALGDVDVQYVWRFLRSHKIDLVARKSWCESNDPNFTAKAADVVGLYVAPPEKEKEMADNLVQSACAAVNTIPDFAFKALEIMGATLRTRQGRYPRPRRPRRR